MSKKLSYLTIALAVALSAASAKAADIGKGNILIEEWLNTSGAVTDNVDTLKAYAQYPDNPTRSYWAQKFERPDAGEDNFGGRLRGYLYPPQTGDYTFWTCSDDDSELWLSTDEDPANATMICNVEGWMPAGAWDGAGGAPGTTFKSAPIKLTAGQKYYVESVFSDGTGGGFVQVGWGGPGVGAGPVLIAGKYLAPIIRDPEPMLSAQAPNPADGAVGVPVGFPVLTWTPGVTAVWQDLYFGTDPNPPLIVARQKAKQSAYYYGAGFQAGQTYYWKVDEIEADGVTIREGAVWSFTVQSVKAFQPTPADGATGVLPGLVLTWMSGTDATGEHVYFGSDMAAVAAGDASVDQGDAFDPQFNTGSLRSSTTYYWRVDTVKGGSMVQGDVWSFTTADAGPANKIMYEVWRNIGGTAISALTGNARYPASPDTAQYVDVMESPVDWANTYGQRLWGWIKPPETGDYTFWISGDDSQQLWLSTDGSPANVVLIATVGTYTGAREWTKEAGQKSSPIPLVEGEKYFIMALGKENDGGDSTSVAWGGPVIGAGPIVITGEYVDLFALKPLVAFGPGPKSGTVDTLHDLTLTWQAGEQAVTHDVYFGSDANAVTAADQTSPLFMGNQADLSLDVSDLEWNTTYYWRVDEVGAAETWKGNVWSFTTADFLLIEDMESYTDTEPDRVFDIWVDGYGDDTNGSVVGYLDSANGTFNETTIVHGGKQAMPFEYDNTSASASHAERSFSPTQNWTVNGVTDLTLFVRGYPVITEVPVTETGGKMSLTGAGADIWGASDQFTFAYKTLSGDGSMAARVVSIGPGTNTWAKGGVMVRDSLNGNSASAQMVLSANTDGAAGNGAAFQNRATTGLDMGANDVTSNTTSGTVIAPPYWVKVERTGETVNGFLSPDGKSWTPMGSAIVALANPVYIGLCVTSHVAGVDRTFEFDSISSTGGVSGAWKGAAISAPVHNSAQDLYVTVKGGGKQFTQSDPNAVTTNGWTEVKFPLSGFTGVNLTKVDTLTIGVGNPTGQLSGAAGKIFIDDIRVTKPEEEPVAGE